MLKTHGLNTIVINHEAINYFYAREKNDRNGNPRYRAFIIDSDGGAVYERIFSSYCIEDSIENYIENHLEEEIAK